jgi:hypothetical protein
MQIGTVFGRLTVIDGPNRDDRVHPKWLCQCECGNEKWMRADVLNKGDATSCGCLAVELRTKHGGAGTRLYKCWANMIHRCENPKVRSYKYYGAEGIRVCEEWHDFHTFQTWAISHGYEDSLTIERIDNDEDYTPENCEWVPQKQNNRNTRRAIFLTAWKETKHMAEWVEDSRCSVSYPVLQARIRLGWHPEQAISMPLLTKGGKPR